MDANDGVGTGRKGRVGARVSRRAKVPAEEPRRKCSLNLSLDPEVKRRLLAVALLEGCTASELVTRWVEANSRGLVFCLRGAPAGAGREEAPGKSADPPPPSEPLRIAG